MTHAEAVQQVARALVDCHPRGCSPIYHQIVSVRQKGKWIVGTLVMFDGRVGVVKIGQWGPWKAWTMQWLRLDGGACEWTGKAWVRVARRLRQQSIFEGAMA